ncbi:hypothetical protein NBRC116493_17790 [Aurantivibrio infirmus]
MLPDFFKRSLLEGEDRLDKKHSLQLRGVNNKDGTLRWVYPSSSSIPTFLSFYNQSSIKASLFAIGIKILFEIGLSRFVAKKKISCDFSEDSVIFYLLEKYKPYSYSIFLGTVGENRKILVELHGHNNCQVFVKVPISEKSKNLIRNEVATISRLEAYDFRVMKLPKVLSSHKKGFVELSNIRPAKFKQPSQFLNIHGEALSELYSVGVSKCKIEPKSYLDLVERLEARIFSNKQADHLKTIYPFLELLSTVRSAINVLNADFDVYCSIGHGDYTPWNNFVDHNNVYVFDWELSEPTLPLLYDFFHFIVQSEALIKNNDFGAISLKILSARRLNSIVLMEAKYKFNFNLQFVIYLLRVTIYHVDIYSLQSNLHFQGRRLLNIWKEGIEHYIEKEGNIF